MDIEINIETENYRDRIVTISNGEGKLLSSNIYPSCNAIYPLYKELIHFCRALPNNRLHITTNSKAFMYDLRGIETSGQRLACILRETLAENNCTIESVN